jgi:glycosyltransferase involved in cell wall biosynthesis
MQALLRQGAARRVLFVEPHALLSAVREGIGHGAAVHVAREALNLRVLAPGIAGVTPCQVVPFARFHHVNALNALAGVPLVRRAARRLGMRAPVLWISNPAYAPYLAHLDAAIVVFDRTDAWAHMPSRASAATTRAERALARRADVVFAVSEALRRDAARYNEHVYLLPNAVDPRRFAAVDRACADRREASARIGYVGSIWRPRFDVQLVRAVAALRARYQFDFLGPTHGEHVLPFSANVRFLGPREYEAVPAFLATCDAAWIPHRVDALTESMNPIKLWDYLAAGLPVVATTVAGTGDAGDLVRVAHTPEALAAALDLSLCLDTPEQRACRRAFVAEHTWDRRAECAAAAIRAALLRRHR